jgi:hypothetical protein
VSLGDVFKRIFQGSESRDDEAEAQEEFGARDRGVADLKEHVKDPYGGDLNAVAHELEDRPRDPNP